MQRKPLDPMTAAMVKAISRRRVLQAGAFTSVAAFASACGIAAKPRSSASVAPDLSDKEQWVDWSTWIEYIDVDDNGNRPTLDRFLAETGIKVNYNEDYNDNNEFYAKVRPQLEAGQPIGRDLVTATDWMAGLWIEKGYTQMIDYNNVLNGVHNLGDAWRGVGFDPNRNHTLPWFSGIGGLGWNKKMLKELTGKSEIRTVDELWDPKLKGRISILSEMRDSIGVILMSMGKRADEFTDGDFEGAIAILQEQIDSGQIRNLSGNDYKAQMARGEIVAAIAWSGDMLNDTETYGFATPESGGTLWTDNMLIPVGARHKRNAERWMDFYYDPVNAATVADWVCYISPVEGAQQAMEQINPDAVNNQAIFPDDETKKLLQVFMQLNAKQQSSFEQQFQALAGA